MSAPSVSDYTDLITSHHRGRPKFSATVEQTVSPISDLMGFLSELPAAFDLDQAIGKQLDIVGEWVGLSRYITVPIDQPWFSWDVSGRGWDQGIWKGPYSAMTGRSPLDDGTFRDLLHAKIFANAWDGTVHTAGPILNSFYGGYGCPVVVEDRQDMSLNFLVPGATPALIILSIMSGRYIPIKPAGVKTSYVLPSVSGGPVFGFDVSTSTVSGWDTGSWGVSPDYLLGIS